VHEPRHCFFERALVVLAIDGPLRRIDGRPLLLGRFKRHAQARAEIFGFFIDEMADDFEDGPLAGGRFPACVIGFDAPHDGGQCDAEVLERFDEAGGVDGHARG
jgi:hypothetical protein